MYRANSVSDPGAAASEAREVEIAIVGAGFSGLGMAMALKDGGFDDFVVLERADDLGGTWRDNTYPGCACDIPSVLYSWSDAQNPRWTRACAAQQEIWDYMREEVARHGVLDRIRLRTEVLGARWDADARRWEIETSRGTVRAAVA